MSAAVSFLTPDRAKLLFVVEWILFSALLLVQSRRIVPGLAVNLLVALGFFYLWGCGFAQIARRRRVKHIGVRYLSLLAIGLVVLDHVMKSLAYSHIPLGESTTIIPGVLSFAHGENAVGSWFFATFGLGSLASPASIVAGLVVLVMSPALYLFYVHRHRRSGWSAIAYVCLTAGTLSYVIDLGVRGVVVDYIRLAGVTTADLKDILLLFGAAAFVAEAVENPAVSLKWSGWRGEVRELRDLVGSFKRYIVTELFGARR
jgi:lipoprotein signal peptidase